MMSVTSSTMLISVTLVASLSGVVNAQETPSCEYTQTTCASILQANESAASGRYSVYVGEEFGAMSEVWCDMDPNGPWTVWNSPAMNTLPSNANMPRCSYNVDQSDGINEGPYLACYAGRHLFFSTSTDPRAVSKGISRDSNNSGVVDDYWVTAVNITGDPEGAEIHSIGTWHSAYGIWFVDATGDYIRRLNPDFSWAQYAGFNNTANGCSATYGCYLGSGELNLKGTMFSILGHAGGGPCTNPQMQTYCAKLNDAPTIIPAVPLLSQPPLPDKFPTCSGDTTAATMSVEEYGGPTTLTLIPENTNYIGYNWPYTAFGEPVPATCYVCQAAPTVAPTTSAPTCAVLLESPFVGNTSTPGDEPMCEFGGVHLDIECSWFAIIVIISLLLNGCCCGGCFHAGKRSRRETTNESSVAQYEAPADHRVVSNPAYKDEGNGVAGYMEVEAIEGFTAST